MKKSGKRWVVGTTVFIGVLVMCFVAVAARPVEQSYKFIQSDHPVDMWRDGADKWSYYSIGKGTTAELATTVRTELGKEGFTEDKTHKPWYRFVKGDREVVVCNHDEFAVNGGLGAGKLSPSRSPGGAPVVAKWPCVLVKNGPGTSEPLFTFKIKKLVHGW